MNVDTSNHNLFQIKSKKILMIISPWFLNSHPPGLSLYGLTAERSADSTNNTGSILPAGSSASRREESVPVVVVDVSMVSVFVLEGNLKVRLRPCVSSKSSPTPAPTQGGERYLMSN